MLDKLRSLLPSRQPAAPAEPVGETLLFNAYCTRVQIPKPPFAHVLHLRRDVADPELLAHLNDFCGYVLDRGDGEMSRDKYHVILHLQRVQHHLAVSIGADDTAALYAWAKEANAVLFTKQGDVLDADGHVLVDEDTGEADAQARVPYPPQAWTRKAASEAALAARGIVIPDDLPPLVSEEELVLQERDDIIGRARALLVTALRAESVASGEPMSTDALLSKMPLADDYLSAEERAFLALDTPSQQECAQFMWRYESLYLLEWALGMVDELPFPAESCDTASTVAKLIEMRGPAVRAESAILDALDLTYRLHWHIRQQRLKKRGDTPGVDADVVMERHHALNWLVRFQHAGWDHVDTPT
ncbi:MAG TPA: DUF4272 domain-containing protein [Telluria sp.]